MHSTKHCFSAAIGKFPPPHSRSLFPLLGHRCSSFKIGEGIRIRDHKLSGYLYIILLCTLSFQIYRKDLMNEFPPDLSCVSQLIIDTVLGRQVCFKPEAAIVNYYHLDSSLSGHTDHSEFDLTAPLISIRYVGHFFS